MLVWPGRCHASVDWPMCLRILVSFYDTSVLASMKQPCVTKRTILLSVILVEVTTPLQHARYVHSQSCCVGKLRGSAAFPTWQHTLWTEHNGMLRALLLCQYQMLEHPQTCGKKELRQARSCTHCVTLPELFRPSGCQNFGQPEGWNVRAGCQERSRKRPVMQSFQASIGAYPDVSSIA
jgi:hypothetical protein